MFLKQQMNGMISEGSCDIEDWSNDAKKLGFAMTGIHYIL